MQTQQPFDLGGKTALVTGGGSGIGLDESAPPIDIRVNNTGVTWGEPVLEHSMKGWDRVYDTNVRGLFRLSQLASPASAYVTGHILAVDGGMLAR